MKISQVVEKTGLTERTIRYYCEEGLVSPKTYEVSGRLYRDYSKEDIKRLETVAALRKALFTIEEIKTMLSSSDRITDVLTGYHRRISAETRERLDILNAINQIDFTNVDSIDVLVSRMASVSRRMELPPRDVNPDFSRFDSESREEKDAEYVAYQEREASRYLWGQRIVITIAVVNVIMSILSAFVGQFNFFSFVWQLVCSGLLVMGYGWVRYLFITGGFISAFMYIVLFWQLLGYHPDGLAAGFAEVPLLFIFAFLVFLNSAVSASLLLFHKGVHDFLYAQKNG